MGVNDENIYLHFWVFEENHHTNRITKWCDAYIKVYLLSKSPPAAVNQLDRLRLIEKLIAKNKGYMADTWLIHGLTRNSPKITITRPTRLHLNNDSDFGLFLVKHKESYFWQKIIITIFLIFIVHKHGDLPLALHHSKITVHTMNTTTCIVQTAVTNMVPVRMVVTNLAKSLNLVWKTFAGLCSGSIASSQGHFYAFFT